MQVYESNTFPGTPIINSEHSKIILTKNFFFINITATDDIKLQIVITSLTPSTIRPRL
ncbi:hypothetical protein BDR04DRAFT_1001032 [Suillus decipiens]|nr:hypothetical protein BDR04DRAFT_1001032 [Suillus decipiens]